MDKQNFQRKGNKANAIIGSDFEAVVMKQFEPYVKNLQRPFKIPIGLTSKKQHAFDFGNDEILVECKSHTWTESGIVPSGKLHNWNTAMYLFHLAPKKYKKFFCVEMSFDQEKCETLLEYYIRNYGHLIPKDVILVDVYTNSGLYKVIYFYDEKQKGFVHNLGENNNKQLEDFLEIKKQ